MNFEDSDEDNKKGFFISLVFLLHQAKKLKMPEVSEFLNKAILVMFESNDCNLSPPALGRCATPVLNDEL